MSDEGELTPKQALFVKYYVANRFNAAKAARDAGYSETTAYSIGHENLNKPEVQAAIKVEQKRVLEDLDGLRVLWLKEQQALALSDIRNVSSHGKNGVEFIPSDELEDDAARAIESVESTTVYNKQGDPVVTQKIKLHSKSKALDSLGKYIGMLKDEPQVGVTIHINRDEVSLE
jgi:phage terminase small subunit